jgi:cobalamin biosynthetic protein CobC
VSGPAQQIALAALRDHSWHVHMRAHLHADGKRLRRLLNDHAIDPSGTALFQWWPEARAEQFWQHMAEAGIWVRLFPQAARGIRLGLPPDESGWERLSQALNEWTANK